MYLAMMIVQHKLSPKPADPQAQQQQQMMMTIMPIMFFFIFYNMPSGLVLYFVASMVFTIVEQWHIRKTLAAEEEAGASAAVAAAASGTPRDPVPGGAKLPDGQKYSKRKKKGRRK